MASLLQEIANHTALQWYNEPGAFKSPGGTVIGMRDGYLVAIGIAGRGLQQTVGVAIRFRRTNDEKALLEAVKDIPELKTFTGGGGFRVVGQTLVWSFSKPVAGNANKITQQMDKILQVLATRAEAFNPGKCEGEGCSNDVCQITLINGNANLICEACKNRVAASQSEKLLKYENSKTDYPKGISFGIMGMLAATIGYGFIAYWMTDKHGEYSVKLHCILPLFVAILAAYSVKLGIGRITKANTMIVILLTATGILAGNALYFTLLVSDSLHLPYSLRLARSVLVQLWLLKWHDWGKLVVIFEAIATFGSAHILWEMRPKFNADFKPLGPLAITHTSMVRNAGA